MILKQKFGNLSSCKPLDFLSMKPGLCNFSTQSLNVRVPLVHPTSHKLTDQYLFKYENKMFSAYMKKRKVTRNEVFPKIHILDGIPQHQKYHLSYQKLFPLKRSLDEATMNRIVKQDPTKINSAYIISMFIEEDGFKQMMDEYVGKVLVCGKAPGGVDSNGEVINQQTQTKMQQIQDSVLDLYHIYYFGEDLTNLQREIQLYYLASKQEKSLKKQIYPKNAYYRCIWRPQDQRLLEDMTNWPEVDMNLSDTNNRPFYEPFNLRDRIPYVQKFYSLIGGDSLLSKLSFEYKIKPNYTYSINYLFSIVDKLFSRLLIYIRCIQFTHQLQIPPDFGIQISMLNIHVWLILDRLKKFDSKQAKNLVKLIQKEHKSYIDNTLSSLNIKKVANTKKRYIDQSDLILKTLDMHFNNYSQTKDNPYKYIDALVWSIAFREKVQRYGDEVYRMSEYLVKNYMLMQRYTQKDIMDCMVEFDVFFFDPDYKENIIKINPQLTPEEFEQQFNSNKQKKSYYYRIHQKSQPININEDKIFQDVSYSFTGALFNKTTHFIKKYLLNSKNYDHFSEIDEQLQEREKKARKSPWKGEEDRLKEMDQEFSSLQKIRRKKRKANLAQNKVSEIDDGNQNKEKQDYENDKK